MLIEDLDQLNQFINPEIEIGKKCILVIEDNKSHIEVQQVIVTHPLDYIRNLNEISKSLRLPVSDMDILLIGYLGKHYSLTEVPSPAPQISPYVYFKKPDDISLIVGSDDSAPPADS